MRVRFFRQLSLLILLLGLLPSLRAADVAEPKVTIVRQGQQTLAEYRIGDRLFMIKVTPSKGVPYYLIDTTGDGDLDTHRHALADPIWIPSWVLLRW